MLSNCSTPVISRDNGTQPHRRSPEKRLLSSPGPICRICHEGEVICIFSWSRNCSSVSMYLLFCVPGDKEEALLSPCNCSGSMLLVHKTCLEKWLSTSSTDHCELCMKKLPVRKECRPIWQVGLYSYHFDRSIDLSTIYIKLLEPLSHTIAIYFFSGLA